MAFSVKANADLACPKGGLAELRPMVVREKYAARNRNHVQNLLKRMSRNLQAVLNAPSNRHRINAAAALDKDNALVMQRMFEEDSLPQLTL